VILAQDLWVMQTNFGKRTVVAYYSRICEGICCIALHFAPQSLTVREGWDCMILAWSHWLFARGHNCPSQFLELRFALIDFPQPCVVLSVLSPPRPRDLLELSET
jgi:hypothetical protein